MRLVNRISQHRRDFTGTFACEACGHAIARQGYDDDYFLNTVIADMACPECGETSRRMGTIRRESPVVPEGVEI